MGDLADAVKSEDPRRALEGIRDYLVNELDDNRCPRCKTSQLRTGDTAALVLRLQKVLAELQALPKPKTAGAEGNKEVTNLASIRARRNAPGAPAAEDRAPTGFNSGDSRSRGN